MWSYLISHWCLGVLMGGIVGFFWCYVAFRRARKKMATKHEVCNEELAILDEYAELEAVFESVKSRISKEHEGRLSDGFFLADAGKAVVCKSCGKNWKKREDDPCLREVAFHELFNNFWYHWGCMEKADKTELNPMDYRERYSSSEQKRDGFLESAKRVFDQESPIRKFHIATVKMFLDKNKLSNDGPYSFFNEIKDWPDDRFIKWGCQTFPEHPAPAKRTGIVREIPTAIGSMGEKKK